LVTFHQDFRNHAVTNLTAELFELHNRSVFEVIGISIKKLEKEDEMRQRIVNAFDNFYDLDESMSDEEFSKVL
jgi:predicted O-linked N-acetylglucosamine transferase (SPINDLY family)